MTIFGIIWICTLIFCFFSKKEYMIALVIVSSILQCDNVFDFGSFAVGPQIITSIALIIKVLLHSNFKLKIHRSGYLIQVTLLALGFAVLISSSFNNTLNGILLRIVQIYIYILCAFSMRQMGYEVEEDLIYSLVRKITIFALVIGVVQFLMTSSVLPRIGVISQLLYNEHSKNVYFYSDNYYRVTSTFMEPSYFAAFIVGAFYYFLAIKEKRKENRILLIAILAEIIMSFSSSAYGAFVIAGILFFACSREGKLKIALVATAIIGFGIMYFAFYNVLDSVIFSKMASNSGVGRYYLNQEAISNFQASPIIGNGYKTSRASSLLYTLLAETGVVGLGLYLWANIQIVLPSIFQKKNRRMPSHYVGLSIAVISAVIVQLIAVPDLDNCSYWMWMNLLFLYLSSNKEDRKFNEESII